MAVLHDVTNTDDSQGLDVQALTRAVREFNGLKRQVDLLTARQKSIRNDLMDLLDEYGEVDDKGHKVLELPEQCDDVVSLVAQRSVTRSLDPDAAEEILTAKSLLDRCIEMVPTLNEDEILAARYEDLLTDEDIEAMFPTSITFRFTPKRVK